MTPRRWIRAFAGGCQRIHRQALALDRHYIPARYPNGLPDITPDVAFEEADAALYLERAQQLIL